MKSFYSIYDFTFVFGLSFLFSGTGNAQESLSLGHSHEVKLLNEVEEKSWSTKSKEFEKNLDQAKYDHLKAEIEKCKAELCDKDKLIKALGKEIADIEDLVFRDQIYVSDKGQRWFLIDTDELSFEEAEAACQKRGFSLPSMAEIDRASSDLWKNLQIRTGKSLENKSFWTSSYLPFAYLKEEKPFRYPFDAFYTFSLAVYGDSTRVIEGTSSTNEYRYENSKYVSKGKIKKTFLCTIPNNRDVMTLFAAFNPLGAIQQMQRENPKLSAETPKNRKLALDRIDKRIAQIDTIINLHNRDPEFRKKLKSKHGEKWTVEGDLFGIVEEILRGDLNSTLGFGRGGATTDPVFGSREFTDEWKELENPFYAAGSRWDSGSWKVQDGSYYSQVKLPFELLIKRKEELLRAKKEFVDVVR